MHHASTRARFQRLAQLLDRGNAIRGEPAFLCKKLVQIAALHKSYGNEFDAVNVS